MALCDKASVQADIPTVPHHLPDKYVSNASLMKFNVCGQTGCGQTGCGFGLTMLAKGPGMYARKIVNELL